MRNFGLNHKYESKKVNQIHDPSRVLALSSSVSSGPSFYSLALLCGVTGVSSTGKRTALVKHGRIFRKMKVN